MPVFHPWRAGETFLKLCHKVFTELFYPPSNQEVLLWLSWGIFSLSWLLQMLQYFLIFLRPLAPVETRSKHKHNPVSIIICAHNEAGNLKAHLPDILKQDYPEFEVVVVNDRSGDETREVLQEFKSRYKNLRTTEILQEHQFERGKKLALTVGIKAARNEWLLLTDADCRPKSKKWVRLMERHFTRKNSIVLGYGGYEPQKGWLDKLIRFDAFFIALQYLGLARAGLPYMGVGRNLAYRKSVFFENKGFAGYTHLPSGDDDLLVQKIADRNNTGICHEPEAHTLSKQPANFRTWYRMKQRHLTTGVKYKACVQLILGSEFASRAGLYISFPVLLLLTSFPYWILAVFLFRLIGQMILFYLNQKRLNEKGILVSSLLWDIALPFIYSMIHISNYIQSRRLKNI